MNRPARDKWTSIMTSKQLQTYKKKHDKTVFRERKIITKVQSARNRTLSPWNLDEHTNQRPEHVWNTNEASALVRTSFWGFWNMIRASNGAARTPAVPPTARPPIINTLKHGPTHTHTKLNLYIQHTALIYTYNIQHTTWTWLIAIYRHIGCPPHVMISLV